MNPIGENAPMATATTAIEPPLRFEVEGANAARRFGQAAGFDDRRCQLVWDAVALNATPSIGGAIPLSPKHW